MLQDENYTKWLTEEYDSSSSKEGTVKIRDGVIATTWRDGPYLLVVKVLSSKEANWNLTCEISDFISTLFFLCFLSHIISW